MADITIYKPAGVGVKVVTKPQGLTVEIIDGQPPAPDEGVLLGGEMDVAEDDTFIMTGKVLSPLP